MTLEELSHFCCSLPAVSTTEIPPPGNLFRFLVDDRAFAYYKTSEPEKGRFSLHVDPERFLELTDQPGIKPARYMARFGWVTIVEVQCIPDLWLRQWLLDSYRHAVRRLGKRRGGQLLNRLDQLIANE